MYSYFRRLAVAISISLAYGQTPNPIICEDSLDNQPPFNENDVPCLLGCGLPVAVATGSLLPGSVNETDIPYCQLNCVRKGATPSQSALAPDCYRTCHAHNQATPENIGWCMYWCVDGLEDVVASTSCVPSLEFGSLVTSVIDGMTETYEPLVTPAAWESWYETQTVLPNTTTYSASLTTTSPSITISDIWGNISTSGTRAHLFSSITGMGSTTQGQNKASTTSTNSGGSRIQHPYSLVSLSGLFWLLL